ncbi:MAG TPA: hypothetical protein VNR66_10435 [Solirubrobacteraceae bacterium]|nr:hypothetical protein [Solirubrobacteraceae bacterium]
MTSKADFTEQEWDMVLEGPPSAAMIVITSHHGGTLRETFSMAKTYAETRQEHGHSELLDELVAAKPEIDHTRYSTPEELSEHSLQHIRDANALVEAKATPPELAEYRQFILNLSDRVAKAHKEGDVEVSEAERAAIASITEALEAPSA